MLYLLLVSFIWAFSWGLIKVYLTGIDANFVAFARVAFAVPLFLPFLKTKGLQYRQIAKLLLIGGIQYGIMYLCVIRSYHYLKAYQVALFTTFTPVYVSLMNDVYTRKFRPYGLLVSFLALLGAASIYYKTSEDLFAIGKGFLLVQCADLCFAFGQVFYKNFKANNQALQDASLHAFLFLGALVITAGATCLSGSWQAIYHISLKQVLVLAYLGTVATGLGFFWWNKGGVASSVSTLAVFNNLKIPLGILASLMIFKEQADIVRVSLALGIITLALVLAQKQPKH